MPSANLGDYQSQVDETLGQLKANNILSRIWEHDHTVWKDDPEEITNRLGWLDIAERMRSEIPRMQALAEAVRADGYNYTLLLGMGGSSLAPEVFSKTYGAATGYLDLSIVDTTDADAIRAIDDMIDISGTLFVVSTKSGGTAETLSAFKYFYNRTIETVGEESAGQHFVGITDPGSKLIDLGKKYNFREVFLNDPNIGGRYSALSFFGLVPATLLGMDVQSLLDNATSDEKGKDGLWLGAIIGEMAKLGRDKVTFITSDAIASFGDWVEQLIAESTGKSGKGILPVVGEELGSPDVYGDDRLFVYIHMDNDDADLSGVNALEMAGHPVVRLKLLDLYELGSQFFMWEMATAVAGHLIDIHPFNQPNVESAKVIARDMIQAYSESGELPKQEVALSDGGIDVYGGNVKGDTVGDALNDFLSQASAGDYVTLQPYVPPSEETDALLNTLRLKIRDSLKVATTSAYGPRFLHSTGQLHKGDGGNGLFIQFTSDAVNDVDIPDEAGEDKSSMTFGVLKLAQALGDRQALLDNDRRVIRFHLGTDVSTGLKHITDALHS